MTVFNNETSQEQTNPDNNKAATDPTDIFVNKLMEITREDGTPKYDSITSALDALKASQEHIRKIESENADLKAKTAESDQLKETLERLKQGNGMNEEKPNGNTNQQGGLSEQAAIELFERKIQEKQQEAVQLSNLKSVNDQLVQKFGNPEEANKKVKEKAAELGISVEDLKNLSLRSPKAVLAYFGSTNSATPSTNISTTRPPGSSSTEPLKAPDLSLLSGRGATTKNQTDFLRRAKENVYKELGINT